MQRSRLSSVLYAGLRGRGLIVRRFRDGADSPPRDGGRRGGLQLRPYPRELLVLVLVALATLVVVYPINTQDSTRLSLTKSVVERGSLEIDRYHKAIFDRSYRNGHWYSDKAPGMSFLAIPTESLLQAIDNARGSTPSFAIWRRQGQLWIIRVLTSGLGLLVATFLVGRVAEGLRPGAGAPAAVTFALGTIAGPLGPTMMEHDVSGALAFGAFLAATRGGRATPLAGALAGVVVLFDYTAAVLAAIIAVYVLARQGVGPLLAYLAAAVPSALLLGAYNRAAFGSPFHLSYKYVANPYAAQQHQGFYGIGTPTAHGLWTVLLGGRGLLALSPVLVLAVAGLIAMAQCGLRAEALVCLAAPTALLIISAGYFEPYGGGSPGPRFFVPALPFLAVGLAEAFRRWPIPTALLAFASIVLVSIDTLTWSGITTTASSSRVPEATIWSRARLPIPVGVALELLAVLAATALAGRTLADAQRTAPRS